MDTSKVTRVEIIDHTPDTAENGDLNRGRVYSKWQKNIKVELMLQDDNRTLKVFITKKSKK